MSILDEFMSTFQRINESNDLPFSKTLDIVLAKARRYTQAEAGTIFVMEADPESIDDPDTADGVEKRCLKAYCLQNDRVPVATEQFTIPLDMNSIAAYVAREGSIVEVDDLYVLPVDCPYKFNRKYDDRDGYRSQSMLAFPLKNFQGQIIGVMQLLNHVESVDELGNPNYTPFPSHYIDDIDHLMTIIGVMVERASLLKEIEDLKAQLTSLKN